MLLKSTQINLVISGASFVAAVGVLVVAGYFVSKDIKELDENVVLIKESNLLSNNYSTLDNLLKETSEERGELGEYILHEDNIISFLSEVEAKGRGLDLLLETKNLSVEESDTQFDVLKINFDTIGTFAKTQQFIGLLETLPYLSSVGAVRVVESKDNDSVFESTISLSVTLESYE